MRIKGKFEAERKVSWLYKTEVGRWLSALAVSGFVLVVVFLLVKPAFMTIDDGRLKYIYAGYSTGTPVDTYLFCYYPLSWILARLYSWFPQFQWYAFYQFGVIGLSSAIIGKTCYKICLGKKIPFPAAILAHILLYLSVALISTILIHFEVTAAMIGTASVILILGMDLSSDSKAAQIVDAVLALICFTACFVIQFNAFYAACCYMLVAAVLMILRGMKNRQVKTALLRVGCIVLCAVILLAGVVMLDRIAESTPLWEEYKAYNKFRVSFWDYPHISYADDPALFEEMGWTESFYELTESMYFMDARFNGENLSRFTEQFSWLNFESPGVMLMTLRQTLRKLFLGDKLSLIQVVMFFALFGVALTQCRKKERWQVYYPELISFFCCFLGTIVLTLFLASRGRLPLRAWLAISIPALSVMALLVLKIWKSAPAAGKRALWARPILAVGVLAVWIASMVFAYRPVIRNDLRWRMDKNYYTLKMEQYCVEHPENVYVYDHEGAQNYSVFSIYPNENERPNNAFVWGSSYIYTPAYYDQLAANGMDKLLTEDLFDENVFFIGHASGNYSDKLVRMLEEEYGEVWFEPVDTIQDTQFVVYKIQLITQ